jgi:hypothetical protein
MKALKGKYGNIGKVTFGKLLTKQTMRKNYYRQKEYVHA